MRKENGQIERELPQEKERWGVRMGICLFCATVPFTIAGANISWALLFAALLIYVCSGRRIRLSARRSAIETPLYVFLAAAIVTTTLGIDPSHSVRFLHQDVHKVWIYLLFMVALDLEPAPDATAPMSTGLQEQTIR